MPCHYNVLALGLIWYDFLISDKRNQLLLTEGLEKTTKRCSQEGYIAGEDCSLSEWFTEHSVIRLLKDMERSKLPTTMLLPVIFITI